MVDAREDLVGSEVDWRPVEPTMGANIRTHRLMKSEERWVFQPAGAILTMVGIAWLVGAAGLVLGVLTLGRAAWWATAVAVGAGTFFLSAGALVLRRVSRPVFDLRARAFRAASSGAEVAFGDVRALQLVPHLVEAEREADRYWSCELNLVQRDGTRTRVLGHGSVDALRADADEIAGLLGVPLWDGTEKA